MLLKRVGWIFVLLSLLVGCSPGNRALDQGMNFRSSLLSAQGCKFTANITADYGDALHVFTLECQGDENGSLTFSVSEPETISGITGTVSDTGGALTFDDTALCFPLLTDDQLSPISAPWIFLKTLRSGYMTSACMEDTLLHLIMNDSYEEDALQMDIWMDKDNVPIRSDILYDGKRILSLEIEGFAFL